MCNETFSSQPSIGGSGQADGPTGVSFNVQLATDVQLLIRPGSMFRFGVPKVVSGIVYMQSGLLTRTGFLWGL